MQKTKAHTIIALTFLLDFILYVKYNISFVGQLSDMLLILALFVSAFLVIFSSYKSLSGPAKFYYGIYPVYLGLLILSWMGSRLFFIILLVPFWPFVPLKNYVESPSLQIRAYGAPLGSPTYVLYKRYVLFEKRIGKPNSSDHPFAQKQWKNITIKNENKDSINVSVMIDNKDTVLTFYK